MNIRSLTTAILISLLCVLVHPSVAANEREYAIKAGFIYNFARYSEGSWFNPAQSDLYIICSFSQVFVLTASKTLKGLRVKQRPVEVHLVSRKGVPDKSCNTFFLSDENYSLLEKVTENPQLSRTMLIAERGGFIESGGHINLFIKGGKVRFEIDEQKLIASGIEMSSKVLRLGRVVGDK